MAWVLQTYVPVEGTSWFLAMAVPKIELYKQINALQGILAVIVGIVLVLTCIVISLISMKSIVDSLQSLALEAEDLTKAAIEGHLETRGNADQFQGGYKDIIEGFNHTLDAVINPLMLTAEYVERISRGDIPEEIVDTYYGEFDAIRESRRRRQ